MYLCIDLGSTHFKASIFDENLKQLSISRHLLKYCHFSDIKCELSPNEVKESLKRIISNSISLANIAPKDISAVGITSQAQTFIIIDKDGNTKTNFISWQDKRAVDIANNMRNNNEWLDFGDHSSFGWIYPGIQICLLKHIIDNQPKLVSRTDLILELPSFLTMELTGKPYLDNNLASMNGLYSIIEHDWWKKSLAYCMVDRSQLSYICNIGEIADISNSNALNYGLRRDIPIILAGNDQTSGAYGADIHKNNSILITLGTAQVIYKCMREMPKPSARLARGIYPHGLYYAMAVDNAGGNVINWAKGVLGVGYEGFFELANNTKSRCNNLKFIYYENLNKGKWYYENNDYSLPDYARSVIEYLCNHIANMIRDMDINLKDTQILCAGGGSKQKIWVDILSDSLGTQLLITEAEPLLGVAKMIKENML